MLLVETLSFGDACVPEDEVDAPLFPEDGSEGWRLVELVGCVLYQIYQDTYLRLSEYHLQ